ncbi:hypothetical protein BXO1_024945 (plasmid) [Xanthomonas oryzae pv. oryzae]|nr:hypothetical protein BXO1_024945 [Xanthomonas oryzae pv. oryzae]
MADGQGDARKPQRSAELAAGQVEHRTGEDSSAAALDGLTCRDKRFRKGCGGRVFSPAPLTTEGDSLPSRRAGRAGMVGLAAIGDLRPSLLRGTVCEAPG